MESFECDIENASAGELEGIYQDACRAEMKCLITESQTNQIFRWIERRRKELERPESVPVKVKQKSFGFKD